MAKDYYKILGVARDAGEADVKKAFRRLAHQYHPDQAKGDKKEAEAKFKEISEAYEVLGDKQKRANYDQFGSAGERFGGRGGAGFGQDFGGFDFSGAQSFEGFGDIFETFFGSGMSGRAKKKTTTRGVDIEARIKISFRDAIFGTTAEFNLDRILTCERCHGAGSEPGSKVKTCSTCRGTGEVTTTRQTIFGHVRHTAVCDECGGEGKVFEQKCGVCHGTGRMRTTQKMKVKIPAGVADGAVIRLAGQGEAGLRGGAAGDLFLHITVERSREFERRGADIYSEQTIHFVQAVLGDEVEIVTAHGAVKLKIPAGTQSDQTFKLKGYGAPKMNSTEHGDHYVKIKVEIPKKLTRREQELFEELAKESGVKPSGKHGWFF